MVLRGPSREDMRVIETRQSNLKALADGFKSMMERGKKPAPQGLREDAFTGMWNFAKVRQQIPDEVKSLEQYICYFGPGPDDPELNERIARICLALYFLDKMEQISRAVLKDGGLEKVALFSVARERVEAILSEDFFTKSPRRIINDYLDAEYSLAPLASACSVQLLPLDDAIAKYQKSVASMVGEAERARQAADAAR
jgi:hypothetical protein